MSNIVPEPCLCDIGHINANDMRALSCIISFYYIINSNC